MSSSSTSTKRTKRNGKPIQNPEAQLVDDTKETSAKTLPINFYTPFTEGNQLWRLAKNPGRPLIYPDADSLYDKCKEYFAWIYDNPLVEAKLVQNRSGAEMYAVPHIRAMTLEGLCIYLGIHLTTWHEYKKRSTEFASVCITVEQIIREQKFVGAASGFYNHAIIARDLGLVDKKEHSGPGGGPIPITKDMDPKEAAAIYAQTVKGVEDDT